MKPGIYGGIPNAEYHATKDSYGSSTLKLMDVPALAKHRIDNPGEYKEVFRVGSAIHTYVLEPEYFNREFLTGITKARRSNDDKLAWVEWYAENGWTAADQHILIEKKPAATWNAEFERVTGKNMVTPQEIEEISLMSESVAANPNAMQLLQDGKAEQSIFWQDQETGLNLRCRPDFMNDFCSDLKSIQTVDNYAIDRAIANLGYDVQAAMYSDGIHQITGEVKPFTFIFIQKTAPYLCRVISLSTESMQIGWEKYEERKRALKSCLDADSWPGIPDDLDHTLFSRA